MNPARIAFIPPATRQSLESYLYRTRSPLAPAQAVAAAVALWLEQQAAADTFSLRGYQWKQLFLPEGSCLRMTYKEMTFFAKVVGDDILYRGQQVSPSQMAKLVGGDGRNAWRDLWVHLPGERNWANAARLRAQMQQRLEQQRLEQQPLSPAEAIAAAAKAMNTTLSAAMLLIQHVDHQSSTVVERRLPKNRRVTDLMEDVH